MKRKKKDKELCPTCHIHPAEPLHECPYREDVYGDSESKCDCCRECQHNCAMDI